VLSPFPKRVPKGEGERTYEGIEKFITYKIGL
jgi:hypothetical protein